MSGPVATFAELYWSVHWPGSTPAVAFIVPSHVSKSQFVGTPFEPTPFSKLEFAMTFVLDPRALTVFGSVGRELVTASRQRSRRTVFPVRMARIRIEDAACGIGGSLPLIF